MRKVLGVYTGVVLAVLYAPVVVLVAFSFNESRYGIAWTGFTLEWYRRMFENYEIRIAMENTLMLASISTALSVVLGTAAALALRDRFRGKRVFTTLVSLPLVVPDIVLAVALVAMFYAMGVGLSLTTAVIAHATFNLSYVAVVVSARLQGMDRSIELAAQDLGAGPIRTFWKVTLPTILPGVLSGGLLAFTLSFDDLVLTYFTIGSRNATLPVKIYSSVRFAVTPEINAVSTIVLLASLALIVVSLRLSRVPLSGGGR